MPRHPGGSRAEAAKGIAGYRSGPLLQDEAARSGKLDAVPFPLC
jgi:hypothetical protein